MVEQIVDMGKNSAYFSLCLYTLPFKYLFAFLKDFNYIRDTERTLQYLVLATVNFLSKHKNSLPLQYRDLIKKATRKNKNKKIKNCINNTCPCLDLD